MREGGAAWERPAGSQCRFGASVVPIMVFLRPLVFVTFYAIAMTTARSQEEEVMHVTGVAGRPSDLPCYLHPRTHGDRPKLILWYKRGIRTPVFTYDGREPQLQSGTYEAGGYLKVTHNAANLTLTSVAEDSGGVYECRVDFFRSPTHTSLVNLTIIEPPRSVEVHDSQTGRAEHGLVGPYHEGQKVILTCIAKRGSPLPNVTWWRDDRLLDETWEAADDGRPVVNNSLVVERLTREWHNATLTCAASNTRKVDPLTTSVVVKMFLLPTSVVIRGSGPVREGGMAELLCTSRGSRPPANLTWAFEGETMGAVQQDGGFIGSSVSTSRLLVNVTREHNGSQVACVATNPTRPDAPVTNTTTITVHYAPRVTATMGQNFDPSLLREGVDVYFDCLVSANPPATPITWYHEGKALVQNRTAGVILAGNSLALQGVRRSQAGRYTCAATNPLGHATSDPVTLRIKYTPECLSRPTAYFIYDKPINVTCTVSSYPAVSVILWQWNNSNEVIETQSVVVDQDKASAQLTVQPLQGKEDRKLSCWAVNEMGKQTQPCDFAVKVAKTPLPLSSCRLANITASSLSLTCQRPDLNAADTTLYRAEVYFENRTLFANVTSHRPNFNVSSLDAGTSYQIKVYVTHGPVTSQPVVVSAYTSRSMTPQDSRDGGTSVGKVLGGLLLLLLVVVAGAWVRHLRRRRTVAAGERKKHEIKIPSDETNPDVVPTAVEDTFDLLSAGAAKSEVPILTPVYEAVAATLSEGMARKSMASAEVYPAVRGAAEGPGQRRAASRDTDTALLMHQKDSIESLQEARLQQKGSPDCFARMRLQEEAVDFAGGRMDPRLGPDDFPRVRLHHGAEAAAYMERSPAESETPEDFPMPRHTEVTSPEDYSTVRLPVRSSDEYRDDGRAELYCPVDQLMQAAETVV